MNGTSWTVRFAHASFVVSAVCLVVAVILKLAGAEIGPISVRSLYAVAMILGVYSVAFSLCGQGKTSQK